MLEKDAVKFLILGDSILGLLVVVLEFCKKLVSERKEADSKVEGGSGLGFLTGMGMAAGGSILCF